MSLSEETLSLKEQLPFTSSSAAIAVKLKEQQELDEQKEAFFRSGGKVSVYDVKASLVSKQTVDLDTKRRIGAKAKNNPEGLVINYCPKNIPANRRMNITEKKLVSKTVYTVNISGIFYGSFPTEEEAIKFRDSKRELFGMKRADY